MANRRNAIKKIRSDEQKRLRNKSVKSELRTLARKFIALCLEKDKAKAKDHCRLLFSKLDKAVKKGVVREGAANRTKSRISKRLAVTK